MRLELDDRYVDLVGDGIDGAIRIGELTDSTLVSRRLADNRWVLCASPGDLRRRGIPDTPADLAAHDCLLLVGRDSRQDVWQLGDGAGGMLSVPVSGRFESNLGQALRDAALGDVGIALHSLWHVHADLRQGRLQRMLPGYALATTAIHAVIPQHRFVPVRVFIDFLAAQFAPPLWQEALERQVSGHVATTPAR